MTTIEADRTAAEPVAADPPLGTPLRRPRHRALRPVLIMVIGVLALIPVFGNYIASAQPDFWGGWDHFSQGLVLAKIESTTPGAIAQAAPEIGLVLAMPNPIAPYDTFGGLDSGTKSTSTSYAEYRVQLGLQGYLFTGAYHLGCTSVVCLETVNSAMTGAALIGFTLLLGLIAPRSFGIVFLLTSIASPWMVAAARNLYWVPWSFFLPAMAAIALAVASTRRRRWIAGSAVFALFTLRFGMGFEFLTSFALLAAGIPLLAFVFGRGRYRRAREAALDSALVLGLSVAAFVVMLIVTCLVTNRGDLAAGLNDVYQHASIRTYGGYSTDPVTAMSLAASPISVLMTYVFTWNTNVLQLGWGAPFDIALGPHSLFPLIIAGVVVITARFLRGDRRWVRDLVVLATGLVAPVSWIVLAKSHAFVHTPIDYVLWYLLGVASVVWILVAWFAEKTPVALALLQDRVASARRHRNVGGKLLERPSR